jgi:hypothetical protein
VKFPQIGPKYEIASISYLIENLKILAIFAQIEIAGSGFSIILSESFRLKDSVYGFLKYFETFKKD